MDPATDTSASTPRSSAWTPAPTPARLGLRIAGTAAVLGALWLLDAFVLRTGLLANLPLPPPSRPLAAATPLYAYWKPRVTPGALWFPAVALAVVLLAPRVCDPGRTRQAAFGAALFLAAGALAFTLYLAREPAASLGSLFNVYQNEEFFHDALRITDLPAFLEHYVELMRVPEFSLHGKHFPPGHALQLYAVREVFGASALAAGVFVLAAACAGFVLAWRALREVLDEAAARQAAWILLAVPSLVDFACTSMDMVFFAWASLALLLGLRAFRDGATAQDGLLAGAGFAAASMVSFSTLPIGLFVLVYGLARSGPARRATWTQLAAIGAAYVGLILLVRGATGFALWECLAQAQRHARELMGHLQSIRPNSDRLHIAYGNPVAFLVGSGAALVGLAWYALHSRRDVDPAGAGPPVGGQGSAARAATFSALVTLAIMSFAPIYYLETERIWVFAMPWVAAVALARGAIDPRSLRLVLGAGLAQTLVMELLFLTIW